MSGRIAYDYQDGVATITMNDGKVNILSTAMLAEIGDALDRAEQDAILVFEEKPSGGVGLASKFVDPRAEFDVEIGEAIEQPGDFGEILRTIGDMEADEGGFGVARDDVIALRQQFILGGKVLAVKMPEGISTEGDVLFVAAVEREEKGVGIGGVNRHRNAEHVS